MGRGGEALAIFVMLPAARRIAAGIAIAHQNASPPCCLTSAAEAAFITRHSAAQSEICRFHRRDKNHRSKLRAVGAAPRSIPAAFLVGLPTFLSSFGHKRGRIDQEERRSGRDPVNLQSPRQLCTVRLGITAHVTSDDAACSVVLATVRSFSPSRRSVRTK